MKEKKEKKLPQMISRHDLANYLGVSERTIVNYEVRGLLRRVQVGRKCFYLQSEVVNLVTKQ